MKKFNRPQQLNRPQQDVDAFFAENIDTVAAMAGMMVTQQGVAVNLTKLVLEHCVEGKVTKEEVFDIFEEAFDLLKEEMGEE
jgi:hypothetical protein